MKPNIFTRKFFGIAVAILVVGLAYTSQAAQQGVGRVIKLQGAARYSSGNNVWLPVTVGTVLKPGSVVQTASESWVDIVLSGEGDAIRPTPVVSKGPQQRVFKPNAPALQNVVRMREHTLLAIDRLSWDQTGADTVTDTQLDLRAGSIFGSVKKSSAASRYEVKLPNGVAGIRGTVYSLSVNGVLTVYSGSVVATYVNPNNPNETITRVVNAGQQYDPATDKYTTVPLVGTQDAQNTADEMTQKTGTQTEKVYSPEPIVYLSPVQAGDQPSGD